MGDLYFFGVSSVQFSSVAQSCPTLCDPVNRSTPGLPVHHQLPEFTQFISVFWWSHVCPLFWGLCSLALVSVQLKEHHWTDSRAGRLVPARLRGTRAESRATSGWACVPPSPWVGGAVTCLPRRATMSVTLSQTEGAGTSPDRSWPQLRGPGASSRGCFMICSHPEGD